MNDLHAAFVLHQRPYRETSVIVDLFCREQGRISGIARGVRRPKSPLRGLLQPFQPLWIANRGRGELQQLSKIESRGISVILTGGQLLQGFYLNELILKLLGKNDPHPQLFDAFEAAMRQLGENLGERSLRQFELQLLSELGYGLAFSETCDDHQPIISGQYYRYIPERGFIWHQGQPGGAMVFAGEHLLAIAAGELAEPAVLQVAKRITRQTLALLLGNKPLQSRNLWQALQNERVNT